MLECREGQDVRERPHDQCEALAARLQSAISLNYRNASVVELVDTRDSKSRALKSVPVRVRPLVPNQKPQPKGWGFLFGIEGRREPAFQFDKSGAVKPHL